MGGVVLLTGGTGFLGSQVVRGILKSTDHTVVALVRARDAEEAKQRLERAWSDWPEELLGRHLCHTADAPAESETGVGRTLIRPVGVA